MQSDNIVVKNIFQTLTKISVRREENHTLYAFWKTKARIKVIIFSWLVYHNKNLVWENLQKGNWHGLVFAVYAKTIQKRMIIFFYISLPLFGLGKISSLIDFPYIQLLALKSPWNRGVLRNLHGELYLSFFSGKSGNGGIETYFKTIGKSFI